ncbi:MAG: AAA family ATPase [Bernardetiaceae bacterium]|nr:AAA family ATPase [Bernardetiaceae bacterium]
MARRLADILLTAHRQRFTGRGKEVELFKSILAQPESSTYLLYLYGPGGQGKTTLLKELMAVAKEAQVACLRLDGRELTASPRDFERALRAGAGAAESDLFATLQGSGPRLVLLVDTYELLQPIDDWLRRDFLPQMPDNVLTVLCGRTPPSRNWTQDAAWQPLMKVVPIRNFAPAESREYLQKRNIPETAIAKILDFTHGHPLALSVVADLLDQQPAKDFNPADSPDTVKTLLESFLEDVPSPAHRQALEVCAMTSITTEALLQQVLEGEPAPDLFAWLQDLSFIDRNRLGVYPHDLAREAIAADLRWRNPDRNKWLHKRYFIDQLDKAPPEQQRTLLYQLGYLHRHQAAVRQFLEWQEVANHWLDAYQPTDRPHLLAMTETHEGAAAAQALAYWLGHPATYTWVFRSGQTPCAGFMLRVNLNELPKDVPTDDPVIEQIRAYAAQHFGLRKDEVATVFRFWMAADTYQAVSRLQSSVFLTLVQYYLSTPGLAVHLLGCAHPQFWRQILTYADLAHLPALDREQNGQPHGFYYHDWRQVPPVAWLEILGQREVGEQVDGRPADAKPPLVVLSEDEFASSVYEALKDYHTEKRLRQNPLLRSRLVASAAQGDASPGALLAALRNCLAEATDALKDSPKHDKLHRLLYRTFFNPAGSQEQVADYLKLPFSTYRRYLKKAVALVTDTLWVLEIER